MRAWGRSGLRKPWAHLACSGFLLASLIAVTHGSPGGVRPYRLPPNLLQYFKARYVHVDDSLAARLQETPDGPLGSINVHGRIRPTVNEGGDTPEERARSIARAFLEQEAALLDIADPAEIKELSFQLTDEGRAVIHYVRHIGEIQLSETYFRIEVDADGAIGRVHATLTPVSSDLYRAVKRKALSKDEVMKIVERDLTRPDQEAAPTIGEPKLFAIWRSPHVVWGASGSLAGKSAWGYTIDAFTGKILNKACTVYCVREFPPGRTPCD